MSSQFIELTRKTFEENSENDVEAMAEGLARIMEALNNANEKAQIVIGDFSGSDYPFIICAKNIGYRCSRGCNSLHTIAWWRGNMEDTKEQIIDSLTAEPFKNVTRMLRKPFENPEKARIQFGFSPLEKR